MEPSVGFNCLRCERSFPRQKALDDHMGMAHRRYPIWDKPPTRPAAARPLRSSRSNRHLQQDTGPQGRMRGGVVDHDPTEGLPVRRWEFQEVTIKQDPKGEDKDEDGKEGSNPNWPWPDLPLPKDFNLLPPHSQELLRRARAPNKNPNTAVFNNETGEYERPNLNPNNPSAMTPVSKVPNFRENTHIPSSETTATTKATNVGDQDDDLEDIDKPAPEETHERSFTIRRWAPLPQHIADKKPEPKYLADRRPGLPPLYGHQAAATSNPYSSTSASTGYAPNISSTLTNNTGDVVVGSVTVPPDRTATASAYRVAADGSTMPIGPGIAGFGPTGATGVVQGQGQAGEVRRRPPPPPPKRKKKGGPGRSKKRIEIKGHVVGQAGGNTVQGAAKELATGIPSTQSITTTEQPQQTGAVPGLADVEMAEAEASSSDDEEEGEGEDEGSEEGEIDEGTGAAATNSTSAGAGAGMAGAVSGALAPDVSIQPPSPDLLGNLESEIQGMVERGGANGGPTG